MPTRLQTLAFCMLFLATTLTVAAQTPPKFHVALEIGDGTRTAYHLGELVPARITLTATDHTKYWVGESCDSEETYPAPVPPQTLVLRAEGNNFGCETHGWGSDVDLTDHPYIIHLLLNRRYELGTPGKYQLAWTGKPWGTAEITSAPVTLTLLPHDAAWESAELARVDALLDHPPTPNPSSQNACEVLRFLDTPAAEFDMARRLGHSPCQEAFDLRLRNAHNPAAVLTILTHRLQSPDENLHAEFLQVLAELSLRQTHPEAFPPLVRTFDEQSNARKLRQQELARYEILLAAALPQKTPVARAESIQALLSLPSMGYPSPQALPPPVVTAIREQMPSVFSSLSDFDMNLVLNKLWLDLATPAMEPILTVIVSQPGRSDLRNVALRRLLQLNPTRGREIVLAELRETYLRFQVETLASLPDASLPELDSVLLEHAINFGKNPEQGRRHNLHEAMSLIARYASPAIESQVRALLSDSTLTLQCGDRYDILAYLHRVDPPAAEALLPTLTFTPGSGDLNFGADSGYETCSLDQLALRYWSPAIEAAMLAQLNASDARDVSGALRALQTKGSFYAQPAILAAFHRWHDAHQGKPLPPTSQSYPTVDSQLDSHYLNTLLNAQSWLLFADAANAAAKLCLNESCRDQVPRYISTLQNPNPLMIAFNAHDNLTPTSFVINNFPAGDLQHLEEKILQYPNGMSFNLDSRGQREPYIQQVESTLGIWARAHGYKFSVYREGN